MRAKSERQDPTLLTANVETIWISENGGIAIGCPQPQRNKRARVKGDAADRDRRFDAPGDELGR